MKAYQAHLDRFGDSLEVDRIEQYLSRYFLTDKVFSEKYQHIFSKLFNSTAEFFGDYVFNDNLSLLFQPGGGLFSKDEFMALQHCMTILGDKNLVVTEHYSVSKPPRYLGFENGREIEFILPKNQFCFPSTISWEEFTNGAEFTNELFAAIRNYFVFGDSGKWGKYVLNDDDWPIDVYCFEEAEGLLFRNNFRVDPQDYLEIVSHLPIRYIKAGLQGSAE